MMRLRLLCRYIYTNKRVNNAKQIKRTIFTIQRRSVKARRYNNTNNKSRSKKNADKLKIEALQLEILELKKELDKYKPKTIKVIRN